MLPTPASSPFHASPSEEIGGELLVHGGPARSALFGGDEEIVIAGPDQRLMRRRSS
ncbi:hypothetical protein A7982_12942 [Minicystis rosea]|nr:hypothetical protein A7982_12942 [Minicystis rosea]